MRDALCYRNPTENKRPPPASASVTAPLDQPTMRSFNTLSLSSLRALGRSRERTAGISATCHFVVLFSLRLPSRQPSALTLEARRADPRGLSCLFRLKPQHSLQFQFQSRSTSSGVPGHLSFCSLHFGTVDNQENHVSAPVLIPSPVQRDEYLLL